MNTKFSANRRTFLKSTAVLGAAALSFLLDRGQPPAAPDHPRTQATTPKKTRYRLTAQIKKYYETAGLQEGRKTS